MSPRITRASALYSKAGNTKIAFSLSAFPKFDQLLLDFFNLIDSRLMLTMLYDSLNLVMNTFSLGLLGAWYSRKEVESAVAVGLLRAQCTSALSSAFPVSQGNVEALDRWGAKTKQRLISYFLSNTSAKNYHSWIVYVKLSSVKIIASQMWDVFWDTM